MAPADESPPATALPFSRAGHDPGAAARLLDYTRQHGRIDNTTAQQLLTIDHGRASYLLKKLHKEGQLEKRGERRWTYYVLAQTTAD
jgi:hypothetical protein